MLGFKQLFSRKPGNLSDNRSESCMYECCCEFHIWEASRCIHQELDKLQVTSIWASQSLSVEILDEAVSRNSSIAKNKYTVYTLAI